MQKKRISFLFSAVMLMLLTGCVLNVESDRRTRGDTWREDDVAEIRRGVTTSDWVLSAFGEPGRRVSNDRGSEIWRYTYRDRKQTEVGLIFLLHFDVADERHHELNIEISDGVVQDFWTRKY